MKPESQPQEKVLTGMRPTGELHLGHYAGALELWLKMQEQYPACNFLIADYQAFADYSDDVPRIRRSVHSIALDWLSVGLDPDKNSFVIQSYVPEHAELAMLLAMITPDAWVQRNPTLKTERGKRDASKISSGFTFYPVSQAADILLPKGTLIPTGEDQLPLTELTREIAKRFNGRYANIFPIPKDLIGRVPRLVGTNGSAKMSKTEGNTINLSDSAEEVTRKVMGMYTDPNRKRATDPGKVEGNPLFIYLNAFSPDREELKDFEQRYRLGKVGDVEIKKRLAYHLNTFLDPIRERRAHFMSKPKFVEDALMHGTRRAQIQAAETMREVKQAMHMTGYEKYKATK